MTEIDNFVLTPRETLPGTFVPPLYSPATTTSSYISLLRNYGTRVIPHLREVGGLARLVLGDLVHRVLGALLGLAVGPPLLRDVHHLPERYGQSSREFRYLKLAVWRDVRTQTYGLLVKELELGDSY